MQNMTEVFGYKVFGDDYVLADIEKMYEKMKQEDNQDMDDIRYWEEWGTGCRWFVDEGPYRHYMMVIDHSDRCVSFTPIIADADTPPEQISILHQKMNPEKDKAETDELLLETARIETIQIGQAGKILTHRQLNHWKEQGGKRRQMAVRIELKSGRIIIINAEGTEIDFDPLP